MIPLLYVIVGDKGSWTQPPPQWWAAVHATYILGAYESPDTLSPLLAALRWADAFDNEWVAEDLPSMFGKLGRRPTLPSRRWRATSRGVGRPLLALTWLAAVTITAPFLPRSVWPSPPRSRPTSPSPCRCGRRPPTSCSTSGPRSTARCCSVRQGGGPAQGRDPDYEGAFYDWEVDEFLKAEGRAADLAYYEQDWLAFYDPEERQRRRDYWAEEQKKSEAEREPDQPGEEAFEPERYFSQCPCGSGRSFRDCCMRKIH